MNDIPLPAIKLRAKCPARIAASGIQVLIIQFYYGCPRNFYFPLRGKASGRTYVGVPFRVTGRIGWKYLVAMQHSTP